jgi:hypothetical protein
MNERFAAEPTTCDSAFELKHLLEKFGPATGRYLATYPTCGWEQLLGAHIAAWTDLEQERAKTLLRRAKETRSLVRRSDVSYEERDTWLQNIARAQAVPTRFDGVVVSRLSAGTFPSLDDLDLPPTAAERVAAKTVEYVRVSRTLLNASPEIHFIDPYLDPCDADRQCVLRDMLHETVGGRCQAAFVWVKEGRLKRSLTEATSALARTARSAGFVAPRTLSLRAFSDAGCGIKVHDRYLLSLYGAIRFEHGFQQLTGKRTASVAPESGRSHLQLLNLFLEGENDLGVESFAIDLS